MLLRSRQTLDKELDLGKFIHSQRMQMFATLLSFTKSQSLVLDKLSTLLIHESSDLSPTEMKYFEDGHWLTGEIIPSTVQVCMSKKPINTRLRKFFDIKDQRRHKRNNLGQDVCNFQQSNSAYVMPEHSEFRRKRKQIPQLSYRRKLRPQLVNKFSEDTRRNNIVEFESPTLTGNMRSSSSGPKIYFDSRSAMPSLV